LRKCPKYQIRAHYNLSLKFACPAGTPLAPPVQPGSQ